MFGLLVLLYNLFLLHLNAELVYVICYQGNKYCDRILPGVI